MPLSQGHANALLNASFDTAGASVRVSTGPIRIRFMTANGTATVNGTELATAGGYTSGVGAPTATFTTATAGANSNATAVAVVNAPAFTWAGIEPWDSSGTPVRLWLSPLTGGNRTINAGDTASLPIGSIVASLT